MNLFTTDATRFTSSHFVPDWLGRSDVTALHLERTSARMHGAPFASSEVFA